MAQTLCELFGASPLPSPCPPLPLRITAEFNCMLGCAAWNGLMALVRCLGRRPAAVGVDAGACGRQHHAAVYMATQHGHGGDVMPERGVGPTGMANAVVSQQACSCGTARWTRVTNTGSAMC